MNKSQDETLDQQLNVKLSDSDMARLDAAVADRRKAKPGLRLTRGELARMILLYALDKGLESKVA